jgi:AcrR family transcriptional regulator
MRAIAAEAGVDPAVIAHFFASKDGLFRAAVGWPLDPDRVGAELTGPGPEGIAARIARTFLGAWEDPVTGPALLAMLRSAMSHETSAALLSEFAVRQLFGQVTAVVGGPEAELRVNLAAAHLIGVAVLRHGLCVEPIASASVDDLVAWLAPELAHYLEPQPSRGSARGGPKPTEPSSPRHSGATTRERSVDR